MPKFSERIMFSFRDLDPASFVPKKYANNPKFHTEVEKLQQTLTLRLGEAYKTCSADLQERGEEPDFAVGVVQTVAIQMAVSMSEAVSTHFAPPSEKYRLAKRIYKRVRTALDAPF